MSFRLYMPFNEGLVLGRGLTPFAIICEGHSEVEAIRTTVKKYVRGRWFKRVHLPGRC